MSTIADRIMEIVEANGGNMSEFARRIGVTPAYISKLNNERDRVPSDRTISDICQEFNVNEIWLRYGEGEMFRKMTRNEEIAKFVGEIMADEPESFRKRFISALSQLNTEEWKVIEKMALDLAGEDKEKKG